MTVDSFPFFSEQLARSANGFRIAVEAKNVQLALLNASQSFKHNLMCGLLLWRGNSNPTAHLRSAIDGVAAAASLIKQWDAAIDARKFLPWNRAALLGELVGIRLKEAEPLAKAVSAEDRLDQLFLEKNKESSEVQILLSELAALKRTLLIGESYSNYFGVIAGKSLEAGVERGERLFSERATDPYFSGGEQTEGGGKDNVLVVDYRLAVALKLAGAASASVHSWRWFSSSDAA